MKFQVDTSIVGTPYSGWVVKENLNMGVVDLELVNDSLFLTYNGRRKEVKLFPRNNSKNEVCLPFPVLEFLEQNKDLIPEKWGASEGMTVANNIVIFSCLGTKFEKFGVTIYSGLFLNRGKGTIRKISDFELEDIQTTEHGKDIASRNGLVLCW